MAATLAAPLVLYLIVRTAAVSLRPPVAAVLPPVDHSGMLRPLVVAAMTPQQRLSPQMLAVVPSAARTAPLAFEPFLIAAKAEERAGRLGRAILLAEEARRRRPSYVPTRVQLIAYYQSAGRFEDMLVELDYALRRSPEAQRFILPELAKMIRQRGARRALASVLARDPEWREPLMQIARAQEIPPADALALLDLVRARRPADVGPERELYLHRLLAAGEVGRARAVWLESLPAGERQGQALIQDGGFRSRSASGPFAWSLPHSAEGRAEIVSAGADQPYLDVAYFGGSNALLAEQTLALPPGSYRLTVQAKSPAPIRSGDLFWSIRCLPQGPELARLRLQSLQPAYRALRVAFDVPGSGCVGQRLQLMAEPGDIASAVNLQIANVELTRGN